MDVQQINFPYGETTTTTTKINNILLHYQKLTKYHSQNCQRLVSIIPNYLFC
jgi:hypothetical protein